MIEIVFFDIGDVLIHYRPQALFDFIKARSTNGADPLSFFNSEVFIAYEKGELNTAEFFDVMSKFLGLQHINNEFLGYVFSRVLYINQDMIILKRNIQATGIRTGIISNNNQFHVAVINHDLPEVPKGTDVQIYSHLLGVRKPDPEIYRFAFKAARKRPEKCLLIDDRIENVESFRKLGGLGYHYKVKNKDMVSDIAGTDAETRRLSDFFDRMGLRKLKDL